jgi:hypothetical protein
MREKGIIILRPTVIGMMHVGIGIQVTTPEFNLPESGITLQSVVVLAIPSRKQVNQTALSAYASPAITNSPPGSVLFGQAAAILANLLFLGGNRQKSEPVEVWKVSLV